MYDDRTADARVVESQPPPTLHDGARLGPYVLIGDEIAAQPNYGRPWVWRARHVVRNREEVLKLYPLHELDDEGLMRVQRESDLTREWSHLPAIVETYFADQIDGYWVIAMEPMAETVKEHVERWSSDDGVRREAAEYVAWIREIAESLHELHESGVLHRDITLGNVLVDPTGEHAKLGDFSLAGDVKLEGSNHTGVGVGTPGQMAPETHWEAPTAKSDQCQLARIAWWVLTGSYFGRDPDGKLTPALRRVLERAGAEQPQARYADVLIFAITLETALSGSESTVVGILRNLPAETRPVIARIAPAIAFLWILFLAMVPDVLRNNETTRVGITLAVTGLAVAVVVPGASFVRSKLQGARPERRFRRFLAQPWPGFALGLAAYFVSDRLMKNPDPLPPMMAIALLTGWEMAAAFGAGTRAREAEWTAAFLTGLLQPRGLRGVLVWTAVVTWAALFLATSYFIGVDQRPGARTTDATDAVPDPNYDTIDTLDKLEIALYQGTPGKACALLGEEHPWRRPSVNCRRLAAAAGRARRAAVLPSAATLARMRREKTSGLTIRRQLGGSRRDDTVADYEVFWDDKNNRFTIGWRGLVGAGVVRHDFRSALVDQGLPNGRIVRYTMMRRGPEGWKIVGQHERRGSPDWRTPSN